MGSKHAPTVAPEEAIFFISQSCPLYKHLWIDCLDKKGIQYLHSQEIQKPKESCLSTEICNFLVEITRSH